MGQCMTQTYTGRRNLPGENVGGTQRKPRHEGGAVVLSANELLFYLRIADVALDQSPGTGQSTRYRYRAHTHTCTASARWRFSDQCSVDNTTVFADVPGGDRGSRDGVRI